MYELPVSLMESAIKAADDACKPVALPSTAAQSTNSQPPQLQQQQQGGQQAPAQQQPQQQQQQMAAPQQALNNIPILPPLPQAIHAIAGVQLQIAAFVGPATASLHAASLNQPVSSAAASTISNAPTSNATVKP